ncbi:hypothetical protein Tco_0568359 [Tanacetum coccineum]
METQKPLLKDEDGEEVDVHMYRSMIGSLMYLTSSRPDIMFAVCACARYQVNPKVSHLHVVKRIFRYLKGQPKLGIWYPKDSPFDLVAYTDSDYARASLDTKSTTEGKAKKSVKLMMEKLFRMELELMLMRVLDLEKTKTTQQNEIASLKRRVKKLEKKSRSRTHKLNRLYKVGLTARVESFGDEEISVQDDADKEMFDVDPLNGEEVFVAGQNENVVEEVVDAAQVSTAATTVTITTKEITLAQALEALKTSKPKGKGIMKEEPVKSIEERKIQISFVEEIAKHKNMKSWSIEKRAFKRVNIFKDFRTELVEGKDKGAGTELIQEITKKQKGRIVGIKSLLDAVRITAALVYVNTALMKLVLLMNFKENILTKYGVFTSTGYGVSNSLSNTGQFLKELRENTFSSLDNKDANEHIEKVLEIVDLFHILDSRGVVPTKTAADARIAIQEMAKYSKNWHNGTSRGRSTETSDGLAAIQPQLNNLGREIKKVNEKVYAAQVGREQCKGPHYTKDCPLKEEGKTLEEAYYTQFSGPFQGGGYRATAPGYYQRNNANPSFQERRQSMEDTLSKFMSESAKRHEENSNLIKEIRASTNAAIRNQGASTKTLEIQIGQMSKALQERGLEA